MHSSTLKIERVRHVLDYDRETGVFSWRVAPTARHRVGQQAGSVNAKGYVQITVDCVNVLAHRLAWFHVNGEWPDNQIDHIDEVKTNNAWANLRPADNSENHQNRRSALKNSTSGLLGAHWHKAANCWVAQIKINRKRKYLGLFKTAEEAHVAYLSAKRELHPFGMI